MRDSEEEYPPHQPSRASRTGSGSRRRPLDDQDYEDDLDDQPAPAKRRSGAAPASLLPHDRMRNMWIIAIITGFLCIAQSVIITLVNAPTYHAYDTAKNQAVLNALSLNLAGLALLTFVITVVICLIAGFIAGNILVQRRLAFFAGFIAGIIYYGVSFLTAYIPGYPGNRPPGTSAATGTGSVLGSLIFVLILFLVWGVITGLFSLLGSWIATRRHPFYVDEV